MTSKQIIIEILRKEGEIDNHYCSDRKITTRLASVINKLKQQGWDFDTIINHQTKNCTYQVKKMPQPMITKVIHTPENGQLELMHIEYIPKKNAYTSQH